MPRARRTQVPPDDAGVGAQFLKLIEQISAERGIDVEILAAAVEDAITTASRRQQERAGARPGRPGGADRQEVLVSRLDRKTGELKLFARKLVVEQVADPASEVGHAEALEADPGALVGGYVELPRSTKGLGRIEAQAAKQVLFQKVREAERDHVYREYAGKVGQLLSGTVKRFERGDIVLDLGRAEALLPRRFQSRIEMYSQGDRVRAILVEVSKVAKGPQVIVSRTDPSLVIKLFEMEVPEIYDGTVVLSKAVREPGERAKVAVSSREKDIDPVGACVGMKGSRVQAIIRELRGEKIDVVPFAPEIAAFAANALNPARVSRVSVASDRERTLEVVVDEQQLSLAIGKKGQNVRLAAKLLGWRIDIKSDDDQRRAVERELTAMARMATAVGELPDVPAEVAERLLKSGMSTVGEVARASDEALLEALAGFDPDTVGALRKTVEGYVHAAAEPDAPAAPSEDTD